MSRMRYHEFLGGCKSNSEANFVSTYVERDETIAEMCRRLDLRMFMRYNLSEAFYMGEISERWKAAQYLVGGGNLAEDIVCSVL